MDFPKLHLQAWLEVEPKGERQKLSNVNFLSPTLIAFLFFPFPPYNLL